MFDTFEAFIKVYLYRTDLFEDSDIQAAFISEYHYPLAPAVTLEQYRDIAEFFTTYGVENETDPMTIFYQENNHNAIACIILRPS